MTVAAFCFLLVGLGLIWFAYFGYPRLMSVLATLGDAKPLPTLPGNDACPDTCFLIVAHNEQAGIARKVSDCLNQDYPEDRLRVLVVSDGSSDETVAVVRGIGDSRVSVLDRTERTGKAACINAAMAQLSEAVVVLVDTRQRLSRRAVRSLVSHMSDPDVGVVSGELAFEVSDSKWLTQGIGAYWQRETQLRKNEAVVHSVVGVSGALYAIRREAFESIPDQTILDDVLIPMAAVMKGYRVLFDSRAIAYDQPSADVANEQRRKVRTLAGNFQLLGLRPALLNPLLNPIAFQFVAHKVLRLLAPFAMLLVLVASLYLGAFHWGFAIFAVLQLLGYLVAVLPESLIGVFNIRPVRMIRTFVLMHWFVVLGFVEYLTNRNAHLWRSKSTADV